MPKVFQKFLVQVPEHFQGSFSSILNFKLLFHDTQMKVFEKTLNISLAKLLIFLRNLKFQLKLQKVLTFHFSKIFMNCQFYPQNFNFFQKSRKNRRVIQFLCQKKTEKLPSISTLTTEIPFRGFHLPQFSSSHQIDFFIFFTSLKIIFKIIRNS